MDDRAESWAALILDLASSPDGDWPCLDADGAVLSIRQLAGRMASAASALAGDPAPVLVSTADPLLHAAAVLGAGMAGRPALMVDSRVPDQLAAEIVRRAGASTAIGRTVGDVPRLGPEALFDNPPAPLTARATDEINTMLLTSGSTGVPKIVRRSVAADVAASFNLKELGFPLGLGDRYLLMAPFASAVFVTILMGVIALRATVVIGSFGEGMGQRLAEQRITGAYFVPTMLRLAQSEDGLIGPGWSGLRGLMVAGEQLDADSRERLVRHFPHAYLFYGMSEHPNVAFGRPADLRNRPGCVGRPLPNREIRFVKPGTAESVDPGEDGQIVLRGPELFSGYVGDEPVGTWFASGDVGRRDEDGFLYITGRVNDQVNVGGNRVSTDEVAALLDSNPAIRRAAVVALDDPVWTSKLVAFVIREPDTSLDAGEIVEWMRRRTTSYRIPRNIIFLDTMPVDSSGKLARQTLLKWAADPDDVPLATSPRSS